MKIWLVLDLLGDLKEASQSSNVWRTVYCCSVFFFWGRWFQYSYWDLEHIL